MKGSSSQFLSASPKKKGEMINDGHDFIGRRLHLIARELKILNAWISVMNGHGRAMSQGQQWSDTKLDFKDAADKLTDALVLNAQLLKQLRDEQIILQRTELPGTLQ